MTVIQKLLNYAVTQLFVILLEYLLGGIPLALRISYNIAKVIYYLAKAIFGHTRKALYYGKAVGTSIKIGLIAGGVKSLPPSLKNIK